MSASSFMAKSLNEEGNVIDLSPLAQNFKDRPFNFPTAGALATALNPPFQRGD
jgi:hypothetical protein